MAKANSKNSSNELSAKHPQWTKQSSRWSLMQVSYEGEDCVKEAEQTYLPATSGMIQDGLKSGEGGKKRYDAYLQRAVYPDLISDAVEAMIGVMHRKPPVIEVPKAMEPMLEALSNEGETADLFLRRINEGQLTTGRLGLLLDMPEGQTLDAPRLYVAMYGAHAVANWDKGRRDADGVYQTQMVVLDETEQVRGENFTWDEVEKYRVLSVHQSVNPDDPEVKGPEGYHVGVFAEDGNGLTFVKSDMLAPKIRGQMLPKIPFVFVNSKDNLPDTDKPPLLGLANICMTIYRGEADYRHALFMQGQDTLVRVGFIDDDEEDARTGAGAVIDVPVGGDAKYIGVSSLGLPEMRMAIENDKKTGAQKAGQLLDTTSRSKESGDALKVRIAAQTATLVHIALSGAAGLERILRLGAEWMGLNPEEVSVVPNLDFADDELVGKEIVDWLTAKSLGGPVSQKTIHSLMRRHEITDMTLEEELDEISKEVPLVEVLPDGDDDDEPKLDADGNPVVKDDEDDEDDEGDET